jgi:cytoskeletal protein RodZ
VLHVVAGAVILLAAITEIWLRLAVGGPWLFGVYGAGAAIAVLAVAAFALSFVAEKPPAAPKPPKAQKPPKPKKEKKPKKPRDKKSDAEAETGPSDSEDGTKPDGDELDCTEQGGDETDREPETTAASTAGPADGEDAADATEAATNPSADVTADDQPAAGALRNRRPSGKIRQRLRR